MREAENSAEFLDAVRRRTGIEVDVVSGEEGGASDPPGARAATFRAPGPALPDRHRRRLDGVRIVSNGERVLLDRALAAFGPVRGRPSPSATILRAKETGRPCQEGHPRRRVKEGRGRRAASSAGFKTRVGSAGTIQSLSLVHEAAVLGREPIPASGHPDAVARRLEAGSTGSPSQDDAEGENCARRGSIRGDAGISPSGRQNILLAWILDKPGRGPRGHRRSASGLREGSQRPRN